MTQVPEVRDELQSDLGWALGVVLRAYAKGAGHVIAGVPGGPRGYQVLAAAVSGAEGTQLALANKLGVDRTVMTYLLDDRRARPPCVSCRASWPTSSPGS
jgi:hypothetical protein